ncbi:MAG: hypothetical protein ACLP7P_10995 [Rhodomicrobium sp.]
MVDESNNLPIADLALERVRRLDEKLDRVLHIIAVLNPKIDGLLDLATGTRADFAGFMKLYTAQEDAVSRIARDVELIKKRLDLVDA